MYFKVSGRHNPATGKSGLYYRLVESYRNADGRVCYRTMLNVGFLEGLSTDQMNQIQKILTQRVDQVQNLLFEVPVSENPIVNHYIENYYARSGVYFLQTTLETDSEELLWQCYNIIREIEATFRVLKTDLDLRPIYHQKR